jgi:uncharacterized protein YabN with tetrapyrrole methylase and pyrophosphatase domain
MEQIALTKGQNLNEMTLEQMDAIWNEIKQKQD